MSENSGKVSQIIGPVVDVTFENNEQGLPDIYDSLVIKKENGEDLVLECQQHVGEDTVRAILQSLVVPEAVGEIINVASREAVSIRTMIDKVCDFTSSGKPQYGEVPYRASENMALYANIRKYEKYLQCKATTSLNEGLKKTIHWYAKAKD